MIEAKKLAKACRKLAMKCAAGTAPRFGTHMRWGRESEHSDLGPLCALGHVEAMAGLSYLGACWPSDIYDLIASANDHASFADRNDAVIFPLLAAADELEAL